VSAAELHDVGLKTGLKVGATMEEIMEICHGVR